MNKFEKIKFVSIGGSNDTGDGSFELPYRTIQYALSQVEIDETGWRIILMSGSYDEPNLDLLPNIPLQAMIPNTVTVTSPIIFPYNGSYNFNGINFSIIDNYAFTCTNNLNLQIIFTSCRLTATPTVDSGTGIFNIDNATFNISIVDSLLSIQNYQELVSILNSTTNSNGIISFNNCEIKAIKNNQIQLDSPILFLNGSTKVIIENSKIYGQTQIANNASINVNKTNFKTSQSPVVVTNSSTTSRLTHCNIDCETNPVIDGLGTLQVAECCFLNNGTRFSTTLNNNTGIYYLPTTSPRLVDQALPQSIQSGALYYAQGDFYDDRTSRFRIPQANQETGVLTPEQLPDAQYGEKGINYLISVRKGAIKQSVIDMEAGNNMDINTDEGVATFNAEGQLTNKILVELLDGTTEAVSKLKQGSNMDWVINEETVTQSAINGGDSYEIGNGLQTTLNPDTGKEILSTRADDTQFSYNENGATILTDAVTNQYDNGDGINISEIDPETGKRTISTKVNPSEFRYNDNGVIELSDQVTNSLAKADSSVQTVNDTPPDADGNVNVAGSLPVLTLISDFVGEISVLKNWLLAQPDQRSTLYIKTQKLPNIQVIITATGFTQTWETLATYIKTQVRALYDGCPNFTCIYNTDGELELSTNDILNPIQIYIPIVPDNESLNVQMKLVPPGAVIVSQPYATIEQVNTIVNNAITPLQQDIKLLNLDMFFADYYIGISINYLLSGKWDGDEAQTYNEILDQLSDTNTLTFTLADSLVQYNYPLTITKQQFTDFATLDNFSDYISAQMLAQYEITNFMVSFKELGTQGFLISNFDSNKGVLVCEQNNNNLAVIMKLTDDTGAVGRIYTDFSDNSLQTQIINNQLIINDVFINKIKNGENVTINVDSETNTATFSSTGGGSSGANKVTVSINGANPVAYNVDGTGNIAINVPLTNSLESNLLHITTKSGKTDLDATISSDFAINPISKELDLSTTTKANILKATTAVQNVTASGASTATRVGNNVAINTESGGDGINGIQTYNFDGTYQVDFNPAITPNVQVLLVKKAFPSKQIIISVPKIVNSQYPESFKWLEVGISLSKKTIQSANASTVLTNGSGVLLASIQNWLNTASQANRYMVVTFASGSLSFVCTLSDCPDFNTFATFIQNSVKPTVPTFTCVWNGTNFVMNSNNATNKITYSNRPTGNLLPELMKVTEYITQDGKQTPSGATLTNNMNIALNMFTVTKVSYDITTPPALITVDNEYFTIKFDPRVIYNNQANSVYNQALIVITSNIYSNGAVLESLPNISCANFSPIGESANVTYWINSNQMSYQSLFFFVRQNIMYYRGNDLNATQAGNLIEYNPNFSINQAENNTWKTTLIFIGNLTLLKPHFIRLNLTGQTNNNMPSTYTINGKQNYQLPDIPVASMANPVTVIDIECANNNITTNISWTNYTSNAVTLIDSGTSGLDRGQINLGDGLEAVWQGTQLFHPVPLYSTNWKYNLLEKTYTIIGGGVLTLYFSGTFSLSEQFTNTNTKLYLTIVNILDYRDIYEIEIPFTNQSIIEQALFDLSIQMDLTESIDTNDYKIIITADPIDYNVSFKIVDFLGMVLVYE